MVAMAFRLLPQQTGYHLSSLQSHICVHMMNLAPTSSLCFHNFLEKYHSVDAQKFGDTEKGYQNLFMQRAG